MDLDILLRCLTLLAHASLAGVLVYVALCGNFGAAKHAQVAWRIVAGVDVAVSVNYALGEALLLLRFVDRELAKSLNWLYNIAFLVNGFLVSSLAYVLLAVLLEAGSLRRVALLLAGIDFIIGVIGVWAGAWSEWSRLLDTTQLMSFLGIGGYLALCGLYVLGRLRRVDAYLAGYLAVATVFQLLLPIQEVFFQSVGQLASAEVWRINQFLQLLDSSTQFVIVLALLNALRAQYTHHPGSKASLVRVV